MGGHGEQRGGEHAAPSRDDQVLMKTDIGDQRDVRADGQVIAVSEVRHALNPKYERSTNTCQCQDGPRNEAIDRQLNELLQRGGHVVLPTWKPAHSKWNRDIIRSPTYIRAIAHSRLNGSISRLGRPSAISSAASRPSTGDSVNPQPPATRTKSLPRPARLSSPMNPTLFHRPVEVVIPAHALISGTSRSAGTISVATAALPASDR